ncbi:MAG: NADP-dependent malic enzyme [Clostridia bacterium]|nr:NADP-dependent malic enzyme [Clostridia bacterium]
MNYLERSLEMHRALKGKLEIKSKVTVSDRESLSLAYTPGVAQPCLEIHKDPELSYELTGRWNTIAVVTDGTAVLGLGDIGPEAGMPVMEGKCVLFKEFGNVDAFPLCIRSKDVSEIVNTVALLAGSFGGINLEDISAPRCFEIERRLKERCDIPVFHDDQHGTAVVVLAAIKNALRLVGKKIDCIKIVISGAGSAGIAIARLLLHAGAKNLILSDKCGAIWQGMDGLNPEQEKMSRITNPYKLQGRLEDIMMGADVFIGVSAPNIVNEDMIRSMAEKSIVFAMANPVPEIMPEKARLAGAYVVGSGRSDFANQINNVLAFPGIFRGALDARASEINRDMMLAASEAIASLVTDSELSRDYVIPAAFDKRAHAAVAKAVAEAAEATKVARVKIN